MSQLVAEQTPNTMQVHLSKFNVPNRVSIDELITFRTTDLDAWCTEHQLKTIERRRFLNAVNSLKNTNTSTNLNTQPVVKLVFAGNEGKRANKPV